MLKRIIHIILACLFLTTTTGFTLSKHYCGARMVSVSINTEADFCCGDMGNSNCCHNETEHFQLKVDFVSYVSDFQFQDTDVDVLFPVVFAYLHNSLSTEPDIDFSPTESTPPPDIKTFLSAIQVFRC